MKNALPINEQKQRIALAISMAIMAISVIVINIIVFATSTPLRANFNSKMSDLSFAIGLSIAFMLEMAVPTLLEKIFKIYISPLVSFVFIFHCYGGTFLGNVTNLYYIFPYFDKIMHFLVAVNLSMVGLALIQFFNPDNKDNNKDNNNKTPFFTFVFALFAGIALSTVWELIEFIIDIISDMNMQRYASESGEPFVGQAAVLDTMMDTIFNISGSLFVAILTFISLKYDKNWHKLCEIHKKNRLQKEQ